MQPPSPLPVATCSSSRLPVLSTLLWVVVAARIALCLQLSAQRRSQLQPRLVTQVLSDFRFATVRAQAQTTVSAWRPAVANHACPPAIHFTAPAICAGMPFQHHHIPFNRERLVIPFPSAQGLQRPGQKAEFQSGKRQDRPVPEERKAARCCKAHRCQAPEDEPWLAGRHGMVWAGLEYKRAC